jgi:transposase
MPGPAAIKIVIPDGIRSKIKRLARSQSAPHREVVRAQIVELAAAGWSNERIAVRVGKSPRTVGRWRARFAEQPAISTLQDRPRSGRPPEVPLDIRARLISLACERVDDDKTPFRVLWSHKALQAALERDTGVRLSVSEIGRILRNQAIRPHRVRMWLNSQDPLFGEKTREVCRHYVNPDEDVTVLCVDEKRLFAHEHKPGLKPANRRHRSVRREFEYSRNGSSTLIAAFDTRRGEVYGECRDRRTAEDLVEFMEAVAAGTPGKVVVIWDNLNVHHDGPEKRWTAFNERHGGRFTFVHTPKHASWLNQVECWFSILERRVLRHASFPDVATVKERVNGFIAHWNEAEAHPFNWTFRGRFAPRHEAWDERLQSRGRGGRLAA